MPDSTSAVEEKVSYLNMSDEDMLNSAFPAAATSTDESDSPAQDPPVQAEDAADKADSDAGDDDADLSAAEEPSEPVENKTEDEDEADDVDENIADKPQEETSAVDYEAEYKRLLAPFKANGRDIQVKSVDDAIALMQMGANYNKKMAALKPNLKLMKLLENNNLLNEEKLSFLIELDKKSPDAVNKLIKDSGINPLDFDAEKAGEYKPKIHAVDDKEIDLDTVLDEIQDSPAYNRTLSIVSKQWDGASKQVIANSPQLLKVINGHVESGIYDMISQEMESERMFGRLNGLSDIEAYRQVGDAIQARGGFNHLAKPSQGQAPNTQTRVVPPKPKKVDDEKLNEKRRAASSTKPAVPTTTPKDFNPLALSDEEFSKLADSRFR